MYFLSKFLGEKTNEMSGTGVALSIILVVFELDFIL